MNELIDALRICSSQPCCDNCPRYDKDHAQETNDCCVNLLTDAADAIERLTAEIDRKDKALQAWVNTWESRKENAIRHICDHCDTPIDVRLKEGACEDCPIITLVKEIFAEQPS